MSRTRAVQVPGAPQAESAEGPATAPVEFAKGPEPVAGLRAADVDPHKIRRAVLTVDGWVCPAVAPGFAEDR